VKQRSLFVQLEEWMASLGSQRLGGRYLDGETCTPRLAAQIPTSARVGRRSRRRRQELKLKDNLKQPRPSGECFKADVIVEEREIEL
jgi:hypothetical protein